MGDSEIVLLARAHALFDGHPGLGLLSGDHSPGPTGVDPSGAMANAYRDAAASRIAERSAAAGVDDELRRILADVARVHREANRDTAAVLAAARAEAGAVPANPIAARELLRRRISRLRAQQAHVATARRRARRRRNDLRAMRYRPAALSGNSRDGRARAAVRAALSRLGRPYVWGATGPDRFDCSGLVQWAYGRAGVPLHRTTYQQIHEGIPIAPPQVRPGDLVFPHTGHVQMAIGDGLVVEAPQPGATVQISRMGPSVAIRRIVG
ncbi:MAG: C40 family peptidase [Mycobacterium sp.]|nr:C40 family peptidase [Mycobacterium sp.]